MKRIDKLNRRINPSNFETSLITDCLVHNLEDIKFVNDTVEFSTHHDSYAINEQDIDMLITMDLLEGIGMLVESSDDEEFELREEYYKGILNGKITDEKSVNLKVYESNNWGLEDELLWVQLGLMFEPKYKNILENAKNVADIKAIIASHVIGFNDELIKFIERDPYNNFMVIAKNPYNTLLQEAFEYFLENKNEDYVLKSFFFGIKTLERDEQNIFFREIIFKLSRLKEEDTSFVSRIFQKIEKSESSFSEMLSKTKSLEKAYFKLKSETLCDIGDYRKAFDLVFPEFEKDMKDEICRSSLFEIVQKTDLDETRIEKVKKILPNVSVNDSYILNIVLGKNHHKNGQYILSNNYYNNAIQTFPKRKEGWECKMHLMMDPNTAWYNPPNFKRIDKLRKIAKDYEVDLSDVVPTTSYFELNI